MHYVWRESQLPFPQRRSGIPEAAELFCGAPLNISKSPGGPGDINKFYTAPPRSRINVTITYVQSLPHESKSSVE